MSGLLSKGIKFNHMVATVATEIKDLQEIPDLGGKADKVEVTSLADDSKKYIAGIKDFGDLEFVFLYDNSLVTSNYRVLKAIEKAGTIDTFQVSFPDGTKFDFSASVMTTIAGVKPGDPLTFTAALTLNSEIEVTDPVVIP